MFRIPVYLAVKHSYKYVGPSGFISQGAKGLGWGNSLPQQLIVTSDENTRMRQASLGGQGVLASH